MPFRSDGFDALNLEMTRAIASLVDREAKRVIETDEKERWVLPVKYLQINSGPPLAQHWAKGGPNTITY